MRLEAASFEHWFELAHDRWAPGAEQHGTVLSAFGEGMNWYKHNAEIIERIALDDGRVNPVRLIQAVAIMSPRTNWERLLAKLPEWLADPGVGLPVFGRLKDWAEDVLLTGGPLPVYSAQPKLSEFTDALLGDEEAVTIDSWMILAAGWTDTNISLEDYNTLKRIITTLARLSNTTPREYQAVVWCSIRNHHNSK